MAAAASILFSFGLRGTNANISEGDCPHCTDTIMVLTVDPVTKTAGMLSIPRDMWVNIPGLGIAGSILPGPTAKALNCREADRPWP